jgi:aspartokinase/homoserine dehydrogenase 1
VAADVKPGTYPVKALSAFLGQALISIEGSGMIGVPGIAGRAFTALAAAGHSVSMISQASSESSICFVVPMDEARHAAAALERTFAMELKDRLIDSIRVNQKVALIAVVGLGMRGTPGIAARIFSALSRQRINIVAIAQGSSELNITVALDEEEASAALNAIHSEYQLHRLRPLPDTEGRESELVLLGFGQIGRALAHQLTSQMRHFQHDLGLNLKTIALIDRSGIQLDERGYSAETLADLARAKASSGKTVGLDASTALQRSFDLVKERIFQLPLHHPILADVTAAETAPFLLEALRQGFHLVLANKKPLAVPQPQFDALIDAARRQGLSLRYEATVGAGLPVLDTLAKLKEAGDEVRRVQGCLSGTLGYLMTQLEEGEAFSAAVAQAHSLGYTEPDPRDDLSGMDVARKALILARTLGYKVELSDIQIQPLFSTEVSHGDPAQFIRNLERMDAEYAAQQKSARGSGHTLRYVAEVTPGAIRVGLEPVPEQSPLARLRGTDNQIVIYTKRYSVNPLIVTGPGAGAEVTAAGVLNDILAIAAGRDRRPVRERTTSARPTAANTPSGGRS